MKTLSQKKQNIYMIVINGVWYMFNDSIIQKLKKREWSITFPQQPPPFKPKHKMFEDIDLKYVIISKYYAIKTYYGIWWKNIYWKNNLNFPELDIKMID